MGSYWANSPQGWELPWGLLWSCMRLDSPTAQLVGDRTVQQQNGSKQYKKEYTMFR